MSQDAANEAIERSNGGKELPSPVLQVDWGIDPSPGLHLTPKFTILGLDEGSLPVVHFPLDERIRSGNWNPVPKLERNEDGWSFYQPFRFDEPGQYLLRLLLIDRAPEGICPVCYQAELRVSVSPEDGKSSRTLEISAEGLLTANLPRLDAFDHVKINATSNVLLNAPSITTTPPLDSDRESLTMTIPFVQNEEYAQFIPYPAVIRGKTVSQIRLLIPNQPTLNIFAGSEFTFGRDIPEDNRTSDIPLKIETSGHDNSEDAMNLETVSRLFSREHAYLKWDVHGIWLFDDRTSGMDEGTIVNGESFARKQGTLLFPHHQKKHKPATILFAKMLEMELTSFCETLFPDRLIPFPQELQMLYGFDETAEDMASSIRIKRQKFLRQYQHVELLKAALKKTELADSEWLDTWLKNRRFPDLLSDREEYLLIHTFVSLGGNRGNVVSIPHSSWRDVQLRVLNLNNALYLENTLPGSRITTVNQDGEQSLRPFCRVPIRPGMKLRADDSTLTFE